MGPHWFKSIVYDWSFGGVAGSSGFCSRGLGRGVLWRTGTYPAVDLELLWVRRLLCRDGL